MIIGVGIDLFEVARMKRDLNEKEGLREELFTREERGYCQSKRYPAEHFAARFCAKEALFKALGSGQREGMGWREIEIWNDELGRPQMRLTGKVKEQAARRGVQQISISLSHTRTMATACVILEG